MAKFVVCPVAEIPQGGRKIVQVARRSIGIFNVDGEFFALRNRCPHQGGPLCEGEISGLRRAVAPGQYEYSRPGEIVRCPWHGWEFDIKTGRSWFDPSAVRVKRYPVHVESDTGGFQMGPYQAETYPAGIEHSHVVLEIAGRHSKRTDS